METGPTRRSNFTGAEIKSNCRLAALLDMLLVEAAKDVVPVARTSLSRQPLTAIKVLVLFLGRFARRRGAPWDCAKAQTIFDDCRFLG